MQKAVTVDLPFGRLRQLEPCEGHDGGRPVLVPDGPRAWRYYRLSPKESRFWHGLPDTEKAALVRSQRHGCFVCNLKALMRLSESNGDGTVSDVWNLGL